MGVEEANFFDISSPLTHLDISTLHQYCPGSGPVFIHPPLYRAVMLTFPRDIGGLFLEGTIKSEMDQRSTGQAIGVLTTSMYVPVMRRQ